MSKRTLRRAAERTARKLARIQDPAQAHPRNTPQVAAAPQSNAAIPQPQNFLPFASSSDTPPSDTANDFNLTDLLSDEVEPLNFDPAFTGPAHTPQTETSRTQSAASQPTARAAQIAANQANARRSTGPVTAEGKATVSQNRRSHGLTGIFHLLFHERREDLDLLQQSVYDEHQPDTDTELRLADDMIQHYWLAQRALFLQQHLMQCADHAVNVDQKQLSLFMRYHAAHERSYYKALRELQNLKKQKSKPGIGFESQIAGIEAVQAKLEATQAKTRLTHARAKNIELDTAVRQVMEAPLPGTTNIPFDELAKACSTAIARVAYKYQTGQEPIAA